MKNQTYSLCVSVINLVGCTGGKERRGEEGNKRLENNFKTRFEISFGTSFETSFANVFELVFADSSETRFETRIETSSIFTSLRNHCSPTLTALYKNKPRPSRVSKLVVQHVQKLVS